MNYKEVAKRASGNWLMDGREKITTDDVLLKYPEGITIIGFDVIETADGGYPVFIFAEDISKYLNGGSQAMRIAESWINSAENPDPEAMSAEMKAQGGVKVKLSRGKTSKGKTFIAWTVID